MRYSIALNSNERMINSDPIPETNVEYLLAVHTLIIYSITVMIHGQFGHQLQSLNFNFRPDGQKKAYVRLAPDYDALDVANKIGII